MNLRALSDPSLARTPIGAVSFRRLKNGDVVALSLPRGHKRARLRGHLEGPSPTIWDAVYGKAPLEAPRFNALMQRKRYEEERAAQRLRANASGAFRSDLRWLFRRHPDLARAIAASRPRSA